MFVPLDQQQRLDKYYDIIRYHYEEYLDTTGEYGGKDLSKINDGRDEYIQEEYEMYISQNTAKYQNK